jgi:hypothetical protein
MHLPFAVEKSKNNGFDAVFLCVCITIDTGKLLQHLLNSGCEMQSKNHVYTNIVPYVFRRWFLSISEKK